MYWCSTLKTTYLLASTALIIGCSSVNSPVGVNEIGGKQVATVVGNSPQVTDIAAAGAGKIWALSTSQVSNYPDCYLYRYTGSSWVQTTHWGTIITLSSSGRCYHINSFNGIWWANATSNGQVPNNSDLTSFLDITACNVSSVSDKIWVVGRSTPSGRPFIRQCTIDYSSTPTYTWDMANPVYIPYDPDFYVIKANIDPSNSCYAVLIYENAAGSRRLYATRDYGRSWSQQTITASPVDAAVSGTNVIYSYYNSLAYLMKGTIGGTYSFAGSAISANDVAIDNQYSTCYIYVIGGTDGRVDQRTF